MRKIVAIVAVLAVLLLGGIGSAGYQTGHTYNPGQITADGDSGPGG